MRADLFSSIYYYFSSVCRYLWRCASGTFHITSWTRRRKLASVDLAPSSSELPPPNSSGLFTLSELWTGRVLCDRGVELSPPTPPLHLTSKAMVIVWRLRENIIRTVLYWQRATSSMGTVNKNSSCSPVGSCVCFFVFFRLNDLSLCLCMFCFTLDNWVVSFHVLALAYKS